MPFEHLPAQADERAALVDSSVPRPTPATGGALTPEAAQAEVWAKLLSRAVNDDNTDPQTILQTALAYCADGYWYEGINERDAAEFLGVEHRSMQKWRQTGGGPIYAVYSRRCLRYRRIDLKLWQDSRMRSSTSDPFPMESAP